MLLKKNRADTKTVGRVFKDGRVYSSSVLTFRFIFTDPGEIRRISFIVPKIISKKAVQRNRLRRLGYNAVKKYINLLPPLSGVFIFKKHEDNILKIEDDIKKILDKIS